ncbi:dicarboxylate/amino acid:cation symporter [Nocardia sp. CDC159]|uniref:Dicarboxylate/amino acid:cation symporter n=1 Tax=Nocardia pulmonis TaxID=2951408 RepID=A0A9X2EFC9_9NOCA|nr:MULTISPECIES: dicarboxylate/amino acid:cation symporter [Nocardia]MCM6777193.1 dicarboxylate/amino acid:cation symporter [Nocardia pulmonis]MCM6790078.1 dicarboxylate/amino acid:cation symporter [Nocardia sp. CDC159]
MSSSISPARVLNPVRWSFGVQILLGLVVGVAAGFIARTWDIAWLAATLKQVGGIFVQLLKLAVPPLVFTAVLVSVAGLRHVTNAARLAGRTLLWFLGTSLIAVAVGIALGLITNPGHGVNLSLTGAKEPETRGGWTDFLTGIVPTNVVGAFTGGNVLQLVFLGLVFGIAALKLGEAAKPVLTLAESVLDLVQKALWWVIRLAPIGTAGLIGKAVASYGWDLLRPLATFAAAVYLGCFIVLLVVYPALLRLVAGVNPIRFYAKAWPAIELAFVSRSSIGTMPLTQRMTTERLGVPGEYASFAVPFGATTKMDGCAAVYPALAAIFVAQLTGTELGIRDYLLIAFVSVVGSAATAGLTGAIVMLTLTLSTLGLPLAGAGLLLAIDPILDMIRTATNVAGQMVVPVLVAKREGILDQEVFDGPAPSLTDRATEPQAVPAPA